MITPCLLQRWLAFFAIAFSACGPATSSDGPIERVLLITCDTLRADRLGAYGYEHPTTPFLDEFAEAGVVYDRAYSTAPMTTPAMSSLFTGRLPDELGIKNNRVQIHPHAISLTEIVQSEGIPTAAVLSNWVLARRGLAEAGLQQGFDHYDDKMTTREVNRPDMVERNAKDTTDAVLQWLKWGQDERFFLWVHYQDPHGPYTPPDDCVELLERPLTGEAQLGVGTKQHGRGELPEYQALDGLRAPEQYRIRYDAEIRFFDREVGRLLRYFEKKGLLEGTLVIFTADHGESMGERNFWFSHGQHLHDELVRVPFIVRYPKGYAHPPTQHDGTYDRVPAMVSHLDVMPTILEAFELKGPTGYGQSLLTEEITGERLVAHMGAGWYGVTAGRFRTMTMRSNTYLYDVLEDPYESHDISKDNEARIGEIMQRFASLKESLVAVALEGVAIDKKEADLKALEALGYTGEEDEHDPVDQDDGHGH